MVATLAEISTLNEKVRSCYADVDGLLRQLQQFEKTYRMSSQEFFKKFTDGSLPHEADFFEWYAYLDMSKKLVAKIRELERELGDAIEQKILEPA